METSPKPFKLGLALSGGGTRGVAHAGILKVLEDNGIKPDIISGASAGALVAALYGRGYSPHHIVEFFDNAAIFNKKLFSLEMLGLIKASGFEETMKGYFPENSFESLKIPIRVMTTNLMTGEGVVHQNGELIKPLLASAAVPGIFSPVEINGDLHSDGGIYSNLPVGPLLGQCEKIIGIYVHPISSISQKDLKSPLDVMGRSYDISRSVSIQKSFDKCDYHLIPEGIGPYGVFDIENLEKVYGIGYRAGLDHIDQIKEAIQA